MIMKNLLIILLAIFETTAYSQCDRYFKKYESLITKTSYYIGKDMRMVNVNAVGGWMDLYTQDGNVYFQASTLISKENTCWDPETSSITLHLESGQKVTLPFGEASYVCDDEGDDVHTGSFLISKENMKLLESSEATEMTVQFKTYFTSVEIPEEVNDDLMNRDIKTFPRKQLKESMTCLMEYGY